MSLRTSPQAGVAIPPHFFCICRFSILRRYLKEIATPVFALARNDIRFLFTYTKSNARDQIRSRALLS